MAECIVLDESEEYLSKIPAVIEILLRKSTLNTTYVPLDRDPSAKVTPESIDLASLAKEVRVPSADSGETALVVLAGPDCGATIQTGDRLCLVGRDPACHLMLRDESISRFHAHFKQDADGMMVVKDLGSLNGTFIAGEQVATTRLKKGDTVLLGKSTVIAYQ